MPIFGVPGKFQYHSPRMSLRILPDIIAESSLRSSGVIQCVDMQSGQDQRRWESSIYRWRHRVSKA